MSNKKDKKFFDLLNTVEGRVLAIGAVLTLFVMMQLTGKVSWNLEGKEPEPKAV